MSAEEAEVAAHGIEAADISLSPSRPLLASALALAVELDRPAYDCIYLALADLLSVQLITADGRLSRKIARSRLSARICDLAAVSPWHQNAAQESRVITPTELWRKRAL